MLTIALLAQVASMDQIVPRARAQVAMETCVLKHVETSKDAEKFSEQIDEAYHAMLTICRLEVAAFRRLTRGTIADPIKGKLFILEAENAAIRNAIAARQAKDTPATP